MEHLDDLFYFEAAVRHGGFAAASRALGIPKSKLSRRVAGLEQRLDVRLVERSTRRFALTKAGEAFYAHAHAAVVAAEAAEETALALHGEPRGLVRLGCPPSFGEQALTEVLAPFFERYPKVRVQILVSLDRVDLVSERVDLVIRANLGQETGSDLVGRKLGAIAVVLVASPDFLARHCIPSVPADLASMPTLAFQKPSEQDIWEFYDGAGSPTRIRHQPQILANDFSVLREAAIAGIGVAMLPQAVCHDALADGRLVRVLPDYDAGETDMHLLFLSRRGMLPAVEVLVDHLIATLPALMRRRREADGAEVEKRASAHRC